VNVSFAIGTLPPSWSHAGQARVRTRTRPRFQSWYRWSRRRRECTRFPASATHGGVALQSRAFGVKARL